ncbi:MAG: cyclase family protein [Candidatus Longimicrobiales bacterium M2_2A_002]
MARIIDISQPLGPDTAVWPGDRPFELEWTMRRSRGDSVDVAAIALSVHTGTHVDGPMHTGDGPGAGALPLDPFIGPAAVVDGRPHATGEPPLVGAAALDGVDPELTPRVLIRTRDAVDPAEFPEPFAALAPALARRLVEQGFVLVGTDAPSVDPAASRRLESHRILAEAGIPNVENLVLSGVEAGRYTFVGLPLRLANADSSPVRAVLVDGQT